MPRFLQTRGQVTLGIGLCDRCQRKFPLGKLRKDGNVPGLMVCRADYDRIDPYRVSLRTPESITLPFYRPEQDIGIQGGSPPVLPPVEPGGVSPPPGLLPPILLSAIPAQHATAGSSFAFSVVGNFNDPNPGGGLTFAAVLSNGNPLPTWLQLSGGLFSGTPGGGDAGSIQVTVTATATTSGLSIATTFTLVVTVVIVPPPPIDTSFALFY